MAPLLAAAVAVVPAATGQARPATPGLRLLTGQHHVHVDRFGKERHVFIPAAVYVAATDGAFEIHADRTHGALTLRQVRRDSSGEHVVQTLYPPRPVHIERGLPRFATARLTDAQGNVVARRVQPFCPTADFGASRVDASGPPSGTYPYFCGSPLTRTMVWGIDRGWAVPMFLALRAPALEVPDGDYTLTVSIAYTYRRQLDVSRSAGSVSMAVTIKTRHGGGCPPKVVCGHPAFQSVGVVRRAAARAARAAAPTAAYRPGSGLPDLRSLPAHDLAVEHNADDGRDYLDFGATIWNAGPGNLDVEGFRRGGHRTMVAKQFVYRNGRQVRADRIGRFEFDNRRGHHHWHLGDFARYDLLSLDRQRLVLSDKQSFCLAPTDPIDLTRPGALWQPDKIGLYSACPSEDSIWLRETMPAGWGDTYIQAVAGQSFDITSVPNGKYLVRVVTNPHRRIIERSTANNTSLLKIHLGGRSGHRTVRTIGPVHA
jgi:hypothetical protein